MQLAQIKAESQGAMEAGGRIELPYIGFANQHTTYDITRRLACILEFSAMRLVRGVANMAHTTDTEVGTRNLNGREV